VVGTAADADRGEAVPEFAAALAAFQRGRWRDADRPFATVLASNPSNGPARFYHNYCERDLTGAPPAVGGVIQLEHK
jgi:hypothetical protein